MELQRSRGAWVQRCIGEPEKRGAQCGMRIAECGMSRQNRQLKGDGNRGQGKKPRPLPGRADPPKRDRRRTRSHSTLARNRPRKGKWGSGARGVGNWCGGRSRAGSTQAKMRIAEHPEGTRMRNGQTWSGRTRLQQIRMLWVIYITCRGAAQDANTTGAYEGTTVRRYGAGGK
jgi:hypothetical protein